MGDKVYTLVISVDLSCCRCRHAIQRYLCKLQREQCNRILSIVFDEKKNVVLVSGPFDAEQLKRQLLCKFPKIINGIEIREPPKSKPDPPPQPPPQPPPDPDKEKFMRKCLKKYEKIRKCTEKCSKECEEKCRKECKKKILCKCKCKRKCDCKCKCDCDSNCDCEKEDPPNPPPCHVPPNPPPCPVPPNPLPCPWPPPNLLPRPWPPICCRRPCPCFKPWSNCFKCCTCGVVCWPLRPGGGSGPSPWGGPQWGNDESSQPTNFMFESTAPSCSIM